MHVVQVLIMSVVAAAFGKRLRALRTARAWSQSHLAQELGMGTAQIHRYEHGVSQPTLEVLKKLATVFRVSADELVFDKGARGPAAEVLQGELLEKFEALSALPEADRQAALTLLDALIARNDLHSLAARQVAKKK